MSPLLGLWVLGLLSASHGAHAIYAGPSLKAASQYNPELLRDYFVDNHDDYGPRGSRPYFVSLRRGDDLEHFCGGTLVNLLDIDNSNSLTGKVVVTAASCFESQLGTGAPFIDPAKLNPVVYVSPYSGSPADEEFYPTGITYKTSAYGTYFPCRGSVSNATTRAETPGNIVFANADPACYPDTDALFGWLAGPGSADFTPAYRTGKKRIATSGIDYTPGRPSSGYDIAIIFLDGQVAAPRTVAVQIAARVDGLPWVAGTASKKPGGAALDLGWAEYIRNIVGLGAAYASGVQKRTSTPKTLLQTVVPIIDSRSLPETVFAAGASQATSSSPSGGSSGRTSYYGNSACNGDQGGPLLQDGINDPVDDLLEGVVSYWPADQACGGLPDKRTTRPQYYTSVRVFSAWISNMATFLRGAFNEWSVVITLGTSNDLSLNDGYITEDVQDVLGMWVSTFMRRPRKDTVFYSIKPVANKAAQQLGKMYAITLKFTRSSTFTTADMKAYLESTDATTPGPFSAAQRLKTFSRLGKDLTSAMYTWNFARNKVIPVDIQFKTGHGASQTLVPTIPYKNA